LIDYDAAKATYTQKQLDDMEYVIEFIKWAEYPAWAKADDP